MSVRLPSAVRAEIRELVFKRLDSANYVAQSRTENGRLMDQLARDPKVGGRIAEFAGKEGVKTYIKDALINGYVKEKMKPPADLSPTVAEVLGRDVTRIDENASRHVTLYCGSDAIVVVSCGTVTKWETALRRLLEFWAKNRDSSIFSRGSRRVNLLVLMTGGKRLSMADRDLLERSLDSVDVKVRLL